MVIEFSVPMRPVGKQRPRFSRFGHCYTPEKTATAESLVRQFALNAEPSRRLAGPVSVMITAEFEPPKSASKKRRSELLSEPQAFVHKPDWDNIGKLVCDALNGVLFDDDAQIVSGSVQKVYGPIDLLTVRLEGDEKCL